MVKHSRSEIAAKMLKIIAVKESGNMTPNVSDPEMVKSISVQVLNHIGGYGLLPGCPP
jgi:hypothetical protein